MWFNKAVGAGDRLTSGPFTIDPGVGILTLTRALDKSVASYRLNISATDNGRCCSASHDWPAPATRLTNREGVVIVEVKDINNNAPRFPGCTGYHPVAMEGDNVGTFVIQVLCFNHVYCIQRNSYIQSLQLLYELNRWLSSSLSATYFLSLY